MKKDGVVYTVLFSFIVAFVFVFFLSLAYGATKGKVAENKRLIMANAYLSAADIPVPDPSKAEEIFKKAFPNFNASAPYNETMVDGREIIVSPFQGNGLWGTITGVIGVTKDVNTMIGLSIVSQNETPGLGGRIDEKWFQDQFRGENIKNGIEISHGGGTGDTNPDNGEVDGITGASRTSSAMEVMLNNKIKLLRKELGGGN